MTDPGTASEAPPLAVLLEKVADGQHLSSREAESMVDAFMDGSASEPVMAGFLVGLRAKGLDPSEVAGGVRSLRKFMIRVSATDVDALVDTAGTGGGSVTTFNISTAAALVAAGAGARVAKHGNRSFTSRSGSADVLEALGVRIDLDPTQMAAVLDEAGIVFMFAPTLHPAMRHVGPVRRALGVTTIMNVLGPLTNPAGARRQVVGVADPRLLELVAGALEQLGHHRALVVHGSPGMDEVSPIGSTRVARLADGRLELEVVEPEEMGVERVSAPSLRGGEPEDNARIIKAVLRGEKGGPRAAVVLNAAAALYVAGVVDTLASGAEMARESLDSGAGREALERLRRATARVVER